MNRDDNFKKYFDEVHNRHENGGILWFIKRTDTNQFLRKNINFYHSSIHENTQPEFDWNDEICGIFGLTMAFLSKKDAEKELRFANLTEGGCSCCGHGSKEIPIEITEHEFIPSKIL